MEIPSHKDGHLEFYNIAKYVREHDLVSADIVRQASSQGLLPTQHEELFARFLKALELYGEKSKSQLFQDVFAAAVCDEISANTFMEFGATDGITLSNSFMLENTLGWRGALSEPSPQWHRLLRFNRSKSYIITSCIWKDSGEELDFFMSESGEASTLEAFKTHDAQSMPAGARKRNEAGRTVKVETLSLNDVVRDYFKGNCPTYISVDTEGSEFEILNAFDLDQYRPSVITVEHNFTRNELALRELLERNAYVNVFGELTAFDAWYVDAGILSKF